MEGKKMHGKNVIEGEIKWEKGRKVSGDGGEFKRERREVKTLPIDHAAGCLL